MTGRLFAALLLLAATVLAGCQTNETAARTGVSSIPWNRPAQWEGAGVFGSQLSSMQGY